MPSTLLTLPPTNMLWKLILSLAAIFSHNGYHNSEQHEEFVPTPTGPQTLEEEAVARAALHGEHYGGDMIFPDEWNETDAGIRDPRFRWPGYPGRGVVPYVIDPSLGRFRNVILQGMEQYHKHTCIRFVPRTNERDYIRMYFGNGCWSMIGRNGGRQDLSLGQGCAYVGLVIHELGHAIGLFHEHQRSDRDKYITVYKNNVIPNQLHNFVLTDPSRELIFTPYDYNSIMHYGNYAFSRVPNRLPTMVAKNGQRLYEPYEKPGFDQADIYMIKKLYQC
ncbi:Astacin like protein [Argiope bruennichi]|uniref:Metalloendopeptidase n=1 Tax=Argiope bruennichi TaxID=94029 RepID=A0A8T0FTE8_ARGBR|nr:Astacin like protein [Argiope bruennichi]